MSLEILGDGFDIHGGGDDLVFPHHENEIAQAEGAGHAFARHWIHSGMVMVGGEKMSKSLGNFVTLADALDRHGARAFRLLVLQTHYRKQIEMGDKELSDAAKAVDRIDALSRRAARRGLGRGHDVGDVARSATPWTTTSTRPPRSRSCSSSCATRTPRSTRVCATTAATRRDRAGAGGALGIELRRRRRRGRRRDRRAGRGARERPRRRRTSPRPTASATSSRRAASSSRTRRRRDRWRQ